MLPPSWSKHTNQFPPTAKPVNVFFYQSATGRIPQRLHLQFLLSRIPHFTLRHCKLESFMSDVRSSNFFLNIRLYSWGSPYSTSFICGSLITEPDDSVSLKHATEQHTQPFPFSKLISIRSSLNRRSKSPLSKKNPRQYTYSCALKSQLHVCLL
jgi:hypothetical protein